MAWKTITIGTRGSALALRQAQWVQEALSRLSPGLPIELEIIKTAGDRIQDKPLASLGGKGLFVKEIEDALLEKRVDLAVHSMKDLPGELPVGLTIGAVPEREDPRDVWVSGEDVALPDLPPGAKIGTGSLRRRVQLLRLRPDLEVKPLRGNLDTRLKKIETEGLAGVILAAAGLHRLGFRNRIREYLDPLVFLPAVGQGALALEIREGDRWLQEMLRKIHHDPTARCTRAERAFLARLQGGCQVPVAGYARWDGGKLYLDGWLATVDGQRFLRAGMVGDPDDPEGLGVRVADKLLQQGGGEILEKMYSRSIQEGAKGD